MTIFRDDSASSKRVSRQQEADEKLGLAALNYVLSNDDILARFFGETGLGPDTLADAAKAPNFFGFMLEFVCSADEFILGLAAQENMRPEAIAAAQMRMAGPHHWDSL